MRPSPTPSRASSLEGASASSEEDRLPLTPRRRGAFFNLHGGAPPPASPPPPQPEVAVVFEPDGSGRPHAHTRVVTEYPPPALTSAFFDASARGGGASGGASGGAADDAPEGPLPREFRWNDRGVFWYEAQRRKFRRPALVETGRHAGRSQVRILGRSFLGLLKFDTFTSLVELRWKYLVLFISALFVSTFALFAAAWFALARVSPGCLRGFPSEEASDTIAASINAAFIFSVATQMTIGYGTRSIASGCRTASLVLLLQSLAGVFVNAVSLGLIFARVTDPKHRTRSVFISDAACVACRDGELKFMFRVYDARDRKMIRPNVRAVLYSWRGRRTREGETMPVSAEDMAITKLDPLMLLPITVEHVVDECSPLYGHTHDSLTACGAEIVVSLEGSVDTTGLSFSARQSFLPSEILWGHTFKRVIREAPAGEIHHEVTLQRFHELEPQRMLESERTLARCGVQLGGRALLTAQQMSEATLEDAARAGVPATPHPAVGANTLAVAAVATFANRTLSFRVADSRSPWGTQFAFVEARAYVHRFLPGGSSEGGSRRGRAARRHDARELALRPRGSVPGASGASAGPARLCLWAPAVLDHVVDESSPLFPGESAALESRVDLSNGAEIVLVLEGVSRVTGAPAARRRCFRERDVKVGMAFAECVAPSPKRALFAEPRVDFERFHDVVQSVQGETT